MLKTVQNVPVLCFVIIATLLEVSGDAMIRKSIYSYTGPARLVLMCAGGLLVFGYGFTLNLAPLEFRELVGLYIASLFIVWQLINFIAFKTMPTLPIVVGGILIITGGAIISYWKPH